MENFVAFYFHLNMKKICKKRIYENINYKYFKHYETWSLQSIKAVSNYVLDSFEDVDIPDGPQSSYSVG